MSLENLLESAKSLGAQIDERIQFVETDHSGISAFCKDKSFSENSASISIEIPNVLIIKPDDAYRALNIEKNDSKSSLIFKFYIAMLKQGMLQNETFKPYIDLLPTNISSPLSMNEESLYIFEHTSLKESMIKQKLELLKQDYDAIIEHYGSSRMEFANVSFKMYLWSHLIITSRAFPYKIVNSSANSHDVMLLPVIDLLNHKPNSKVEWSSSSTETPSNSGNFKLSILPSGLNQQESHELFNNYGPKGNAELLLGYGFVLQDNEYDSLQLSLTLDKQLKSNLITHWNVKLPTISDYTFNVNDNGNKENSELDPVDDTTVFMLNKFHPIADGLLELFCYISKNEEDECMTLKNCMNGLTKLRASLELKYANKLDRMPIFKEELVRLDDYDNAKIFREGQLKIYNLAKNEIKNMEKKYLKDYRKSFITLKDIFKKDLEEFQVFLEIFQLFKPIDELNKLETELIFRLWLMKTINYCNFEGIDNYDFRVGISWFVEMFNIRKGDDFTITENDEFMIDFYHQLIDPLKENAPELIKSDNWELNDWLLIDKLIIENSYEKGKNQETLLIKPSKL